VPSNVLKALYQLSDKYPIMVKLAVTQNSSGTSPSDPELPPETNTVAATEPFNKGVIQISNPIENNITFYFPTSMIGNNAVTQWCDLTGKILQNEEFAVDQNVSRPVHFSSGVYILRLLVEGGRINFRVVKR
jgi:hypothetical protein